LKTFFMRQPWTVVNGVRMKKRQNQRDMV